MAQADDVFFSRDDGKRIAVGRISNREFDRIRTDVNRREFQVVPALYESSVTAK
jgi:hypothetical protein